MDYINNTLKCITFLLSNFKGSVLFDTAKIVYHGYVESILILRYGIIIYLFPNRQHQFFILWGQPPSIIDVFRLQKKNVHIFTSSHNRCSCRILFKKSKSSNSIRTILKTADWMHNMIYDFKGSYILTGHTKRFGRNFEAILLKTN